MQGIVKWIWGNYKDKIIQYLLKEFGECEDILQEKWKQDFPENVNEAINDVKDALTKAFSTK